MPTADSFPLNFSARLHEFYPCQMGQKPSVTLFLFYYYYYYYYYARWQPDTYKTVIYTLHSCTKITNIKKYTEII